MGDFGRKIDRFIEIFVEQRGYVRVLEGLQNTVMIAVVGLLVGVLIGTLIASVRVMPKYKLLPRVLNGFCSFYVGLFRGTPDRKSTRLNSSHSQQSRMPSSA